LSPTCGGKFKYLRKTICHTSGAFNRWVCGNRLNGMARWSCVKMMESTVASFYRWLQSQLPQRITGYQGHLPWWAFSKKPDIKFHQRMLENGESAVLMKISKSSELFRCFHSWAWNRVFCEDYLADSKVEYDRWEKELRSAVPDEDERPLPQPWQRLLERSWDRLFDSDLPEFDWDSNSVWAQRRCVEGVFETLALEEVIQVTMFDSMSVRRLR